MAAATLAISVTSALAESPNILMAEIPFAFRVGNQIYEAGSYEASLVSNMGSGKFLRMVNGATGKSSFTLAVAPVTPANSRNGKAEARLVFQCEASDCTLSQVWVRNCDPGFQFRTRTPKSNETMGIATIRLLPTSAD